MASLSEFDDFALLEGDYSLVGRRSGRKFRMGDKVRIKVVAANLAKRQLDYEWVIVTAITDETTPMHERKQAHERQQAHERKQAHEKKKSQKKAKKKK